MSPSTIAFSKMHGAGNDFIVFDLRAMDMPFPDLCRAMANRRTGVGCDQFIGIEAPRSTRSIASYRIWTADGVPVQQCGNGARCVAAWVVRHGLVKGARFALDSPMGTHDVDGLSGDVFRVGMGVPLFAPDSIPLAGVGTQRDLYKAYVPDGSCVLFAAVSMGNPHAVIEVDDLEDVPISGIGQVLQRNSILPSSVDVGFTQIESRERIRLRVYEYGAGETLACGSGACAATAVLMRRNQIERRVSVVLPGGELRIEWPNDTKDIEMTGPATFVFEGDFSNAAI